MAARIEGIYLPVHPSAPAWIENRLQLFHHKGHVTAAPEHCRDHPRERHGPGEMLHILGIDEHFKRPAMPAEQQIVDGDVNRMLAVWPFQLIGLPFQRLRGGSRGSRI